MSLKLYGVFLKEHYGVILAYLAFFFFCFYPFLLTKESRGNLLEVEHVMIGMYLVFTAFRTRWIEKKIV